MHMHDNPLVMAYMGDTIYEQYVLNANFKDRNNNVLGTCTQNEDGTWNHYEYECRGLLEGIFIINGKKYVK